MKYPKYTLYCSRIEPCFFVIASCNFIICPCYRYPIRIRRPYARYRSLPASKYCQENLVDWDCRGNFVFQVQPPHIWNSVCPGNRISCHPTRSKCITEYQGGRCKQTMFSPSADHVDLQLPHPVSVHAHLKCNCHYIHYPKQTGPPARLSF